MLRNLCRFTQILHSEIHIVKRHAGHSKWDNIRHGKALKDLQKARMFTKISNNIKVAIQDGGSPNPDSNLKLAQAIAHGRRLSMPLATMQTIIKNTQKDPKQSKSYVFEIRGPGGCIILCEVFSPNLVLSKNRIATLLKKHKSRYSDTSIGNLFDHKGLIETEIPQLEANKTNEELMEIVTNHAIESEAEDVVIVDDGKTKFLRFISDSRTVNNVQKHLEQLSYKVIDAGTEYIPNRLVELSESDFEVCTTLYDKLLDLDDVVKLYDNINN